MNLELFIAKRIHFAKTDDKRRVSTPAIKIAIAGVAIGLAAMILSVAIVIGFKKEVRGKIVGFGSHMQIENYENRTSYESLPICANDSLLDVLRTFEGVKHIEQYVTKPGMIKTDDYFQAVIFKGVADDYDWSFFAHNLVGGNIINADTLAGNQAIISQFTANKLGLDVGDSFLAYFMQDKVQVRKFNIAGIFNTNFEDYDKLYVITDQKMLQRLNKWEPQQVTGLEVLVNDFDNLTKVKGNVFFELISSKDSEGNTLFTQSITEMNPNIFNWLSLLDTNVWIIIILLFAVSGFTMISGLFIIILERTNMIGILKAMGHSNKNIRKTFLYISSFLVLKGMLWGNVIAFVIIIIQKLFGVIRLDQSMYYVSEMPININILHILLLNVATLIISVLIMVGPSYLIARISPAKSIRFE